MPISRDPCQDPHADPCGTFASCQTRSPALLMVRLRQLGVAQSEPSGTVIPDVDGCPRDPSLPETEPGGAVNARSCIRSCVLNDGVGRPASSCRCRRRRSRVVSLGVEEVRACSRSARPFPPRSRMPRSTVPHARPPRRRYGRRLRPTCAVQSGLRAERSTAVPKRSLRPRAHDTSLPDGRWRFE